MINIFAFIYMNNDHIIQISYITAEKHPIKQDIILILRIKWNHIRNINKITSIWPTTDKHTRHLLLLYGSNAFDFI